MIIANKLTLQGLDGATIDERMAPSLDTGKTPVLARLSPNSVCHVLLTFPCYSCNPVFFAAT